MTEDMADIVYVDDEPNALMALATDEQANRIENLKFDAVPDAVPLGVPTDKAVWLFDFFLVAPAPGNSIDENGLSLFQKWKVTSGGRPTTVLVSSAFEQAVGRPLGPIERRHIIAQRHGVEWLGDKSRETLEQVVALADAAGEIGARLKPSTEKDSVGVYEIEQLVFEVLGVPREAEWARSAERQIDRARPPRQLSGSSASAAARSVISWLIAHILPYPTFLLTDAQAALRLQLRAESFRALAGEDRVSREAGLTNLFKACRYTGPLSTFLGRRWWRAAIDDLAWQMSQGDGGYQASINRSAGDISLEWLDQPEPVLLSNADLVETDDVADASECVRVTDEDFPANVDAAWVLIGEAKSNRLLAAKVVFEDRELLSTSE